MDRIIVIVIVVCIFAAFIASSLVALYCIRRALLGDLADSFQFTGSEIVLNYKKKSKTVSCCCISEIIITPYRYIFRGRQTYSVTRALDGISFVFFGIGVAIGRFAYEKDVNPQIYEISDAFNIPFRKRTLT